LNEPASSGRAEASGISGAIDGYTFPARLRGWVVARKDGRFNTGVRIEVFRGERVIAETVPTQPRPDVTKTDTALSGFVIDCAGRATADDFLERIVLIRAVNEEGEWAAIEFWDKTLAGMKAEVAARKIVQADVPDALAILQALSRNPAFAGEASAALARCQRIVEGVAEQPRVRRPSPGRKITFIGAGSTVFAKNLLGDILLRPELAESHICLYDIDPERLRISEIVARRIAGMLKSPAQIDSTTELTKALDGADYAINMIQVGGYRPCTVTDFEVPKQFGLRQTIADTMGIGGIMRALRTIPVLLGMVREMERLCPEVLHLNYVNPMAMNCWALSRASRIKTVGLCHSVQGTAAELARDLGIPADEIAYRAAGINHMAFYLSLTHDGEDLYPRLGQIVAEGRVPSWNRVRYDLLSRFGYFVTESSEHFAEYVPWYIKRGREDLITRYGIPLDEYPRRCELQIAEWDSLARTLMDPAAPLEIRRSNEYGAGIIHAMETGQPTVIYGNVPNTGLIQNLPERCCVEVPCLVDRNGVQPIQVGALPMQLAALIQTNVNVQSLVVEAILSDEPEHIYHAAMLDPHTASELELDQIRAMVDRLLEAHAGWTHIRGI
jgi:alpha-galactosidase